jgi:hypothetical protein
VVSTHVPHPTPYFFADPSSPPSSSTSDGTDARAQLPTDTPSTDELELKRLRSELDAAMETISMLHAKNATMVSGQSRVTHRSTVQS